MSNIVRAIILLLVLTYLSGCKATSADVSFETIETLQKLAYASYQAGDLHQAEGHWRKLTQLTPLNSIAWCQLGHVHYRRHRYQAASKSYQKCLEINPSQIDVWHSLSAVKLREATETLLLGSSYISDNSDSQLVRNYQRLQRELLRLHGVADGYLGVHHED